MIPRLAALAARVLDVARTRPFRWGFGLLTVAIAGWALASERTEVVDALGRLSWTTILAAVAATVVNVVGAGMLWRTVLADLGSKMPLPAAARVFFIGQLGKYLPGSVWPVVMQAELGRDYRVPRSRTATATVVAMLIGCASALLVALLALPFAPAVVPDGFGWAVVLIVPLLIGLHPAVLGTVVDRLLVIAGRGSLERRPSVAGLAKALLWGVVSWTGAGLQVWALITALGADVDLHTFALATGGYALAWAVGFLIIVAPAGAGAREVALAAVLSTVLDRGEVVVVVLLCRVLFTLADLVSAGLALLGGRPAPRAEDAGRVDLVDPTPGTPGPVGPAERRAQAAFGSGESAAG